MNSVYPVFFFLTLSFSVLAAEPLPQLYLQTEGQSISREETPAMLGLSSGDSPEISPKLPVSVRLRGQSSQTFPQKSYHLAFREGIELPSFMGLPWNLKWVLNAPYVDKTLLRNALGYSMATEVMGVGPLTAYGELFLNSQYQGIYLLVEKIEAVAGRFSLNKDDVLLEVDHNLKAKDVYIKTQKMKVPLIFHLPEGGNLTPTIKTKTETLFNSLEQALSSHPQGDFLALIDKESFIQFILLQELFKNMDGFSNSIYLTVRSGKIFAGPVWDFDLAMGNFYYFHENTPTGWQFNNPYYPPTEEVPWFYLMLENPSLFLGRAKPTADETIT